MSISEHEQNNRLIEFTKKMDEHLKKCQKDKVNCACSVKLECFMTKHEDDPQCKMTICCGEEQTELYKSVRQNVRK